MERYRIIVNPTSAHGAAEQAIPRIEELLRGYGLDFDLVRTERPWHAAELAQQAAADGYTVVVAAGGDGTANEVLNGLLLAQDAGAGDGVAMGLLGIGRGNDFAYGMGVPAGVEEGCRVLAEAKRHRVDVGRVTGELYPKGRYFGNGVGIGFDATVGFEAAKMTHLRGFLCYIVAALKTIFLYYKAPLLRIELDDKTVELPALLVSIMNGRRMGGGFYMAPQGQNDDGAFDLCIARQVSRMGVLGLMPRVMKGTQAGHPAISMPRSSRVTVTALQGSLPAHGDGETLCVAGERLVMELLPGRLQVVSQA